MSLPLQSATLGELIAEKQKLKNLINAETKKLEPLENTMSRRSFDIKEGEVTLLKLRWLNQIHDTNIRITNIQNGQHDVHSADHHVDRHVSETDFNQIADDLD